jgi:hypothetical protein
MHNDNRNPNEIAGHAAPIANGFRLAGDTLV